jgi:hypothetical protein
MCNMLYIKTFEPIKKINNQKKKNSISTKI